jgi:tetratricopeptide (TPR) repeat protein
MSRFTPRLFVAALALVAFAATSALPSYAQDEPSDNEKATNYSLYFESYKNEDYENALPYLRWILTNAPEYAGPGRNRDVNFDRGIRAYRALADATEDPAQKAAYLDSALVLYETAVPTLEGKVENLDEWEWLFEKGRFIQTYAQDRPEWATEFVPVYQELYEMDASRLQPYYVTLLLDSNLRENAQLNPDVTLAFADELEVTYSGMEGFDYSSVGGYIEQVRNTLLRDPEDRIAFLQRKLEADQDNLELLTEIFELAEELEMRDTMYEIGERLAEMDPSNPRTARLLGQLYLSDGEFQRAYDLLEQALGNAQDPEVRRDLLYNQGAALQNLGRLSNARTKFRASLEADPEFGRAILAIGDLYVTAVRNCGSLELDDRAVYWLATDYYNRAKRIDSGVSSTADARVRSIQSFYPTAEMKFFKGLSDGQSYSITGGCYGWIGESTTVR